MELKKVGSVWVRSITVEAEYPLPHTAQDVLDEIFQRKPHPKVQPRTVYRKEPKKNTKPWELL